MSVAYDGELLDDGNRPISGVFPFTFELHRGERSREPVWSEQQFVAVHHGRFQIRLGRTNGIPVDWDGATRTLSVRIDDAVVIRHEILLTEWRPDESSPLPSITHVRSVDLAGHAIRADNATFAESCATLSGKSAADLDHYVELRGQLDELRARINRPAGSRLGTDTVLLPRIGGEGGNRYERMCPPGFAMTGARGRAGNMIDGLRPVCTQLE